MCFWSNPSVDYDMKLNTILVAHKYDLIFRLAYQLLHTYAQWDLPVHFNSNEGAYSGDFFSWVGRLPYKNVTKSNVLYPYICNVLSQKGLFEVLPVFVRLVIPDLQILQIGCTPSMSTNFIITFHNHDGMLVQWLSQDQQNWDRGVFCRLVQPRLEFVCSIF